MSAPLEKTGGFMVQHPWLVTMPMVILTGISMAVAVLAWTGQNSVSQRVTTIEHSPCVQDPQSQACRSIRKELLRSEPKNISCIPFRKVLPQQVLAYTRCNIPKNQKFPPRSGG